jgi:hypothetical protein
MAQNQAQHRPTQDRPAQNRQIQDRQAQDSQAQEYIHRFFGGSPLAVIGRLILVSILVGVALAAIGLDPWDIVASVRQLIVRIWTMGFDIVRWLWRYFLLGAVVVLPIWVLVRLAKTPRRG